MAKLISNLDALNAGFGVEDDVQNAKDFEGNRLEMQKEAAIDELDKFQPNGLANFFEVPGTHGKPVTPENIDYHKENQAKALADQISTRVKTLLERSADAYETSLPDKASSLSKIEKIVWSQRKRSVSDQIFTGMRGAESSVLVAEGYLKFLEEAKIKAHQEWRDQYAKYEVFLTQKRHWWNFINNRRAARFETFNPMMTAALDAKFKELEDNAKAMTQDSAKNKIKVIGEGIERRFNSASEDKKIEMWTQIDTAINLSPPTGLGGLDLSAFGIPKGADTQTKINFLEALKDIEWIREKLTTLSKSKSQYNHQNTLIGAAKAQEQVIFGSKGFNFGNLDNVKSQSAFKDIPLFAGEVSTKELADAIWNDLYRAGEKPENIFKGLPNMNFSHDLLGDSTRLFAILRSLAGNKTPSSDWSKASKLDIVTRKKLLKWLSEKDKESGGDIEVYDNAPVKQQIEVLKKGTAPTGILKELQSTMEKARKFDISTTSLAEFEAFENIIDGLETIIQTKYQEFLNAEGSGFPAEDFAMLRGVWDKVLESRTFLLAQAKQWVEDKKAHDNYATAVAGGAGTELEKITKRLEIIDAPNVTDVGSIAEAIDKQSRATTNAAISAASSALNRLESERNRLQQARETILGSTEPKLTNFSQIQGLLDKISTELGTDYGRKIKQNSAPSIKNLDVRIHEALQKEFSGDLNRMGEVERKFLMEWQKNDQFEMLRKQVGGYVSLDIREVGALTHLSFPKELDSAYQLKFKIKRSSASGVVELVEVDATGKLVSNGKTVRVVGPSVNLEGDEPVVNKNAAVFDTVGAAPKFAIITNLQIL